MWLAASALFFWRAIAGRFPDALSSLGLIAVAAIIVVIALGIRTLLRGSLASSMTQPRTAQDWFAQFLPTLAAILLAVGFTVAGAHVTGLVFLWIIVAAEVLSGAAGPWTLSLLPRWFERSKEDRGTVIVDHPRGMLLQEPEEEPAVGDTQADEEFIENEGLPWLWQDATALQELRYMTLPETGLAVAGSQRATLPAAQQTAVVHTVFHPPFAAAPVVTLEMQEPDTVAIKAAQVLPHGVRWELRAEQSSEQPREIQWAFSASCSRDPRR